MSDEPVDFETAENFAQNAQDERCSLEWQSPAPIRNLARAYLALRLVPTRAAGERCSGCVDECDPTKGCLMDRVLTPPAREPVADKLVAGELARWSRRAQDAVLYARAVCQSNGYALAVHGSLRRDIDVVAVPWTAEAVAPDVLAKEILDFLVRADVGLGWASGGPNGTEKPHGRHAWNIVLAGEPFMYLDLSVVSPHPPTPEAGTVTEDDLCEVCSTRRATIHLEGAVNELCAECHIERMERIVNGPVGETRRLLGAFVQAVGEPCRHDHHGYCQAHFLEHGDQCTVKLAREVLSSHPPAPVAEGVTEAGQ